MIGHSLSSRQHNMGRTTTRLVTAQEFAEALTPSFTRRLSPDRIESARRVMVDGENQTLVAEHYGWTRNAVSINVKKVWEHIEELRARKVANEAAAQGGEVLPPGWLKQTFIAPKELIERWTSELEAYRVDPKPQRRGRGATRVKQEH